MKEVTKQSMLDITLYCSGNIPIARQRSYGINITTMGCTMVKSGRNTACERAIEPKWPIGRSMQPITIPRPSSPLDARLPYTSPYQLIKLTRTWLRIRMQVKEAGKLLMVRLVFAIVFFINLHIYCYAVHVRIKGIKSNVLVRQE